MNSPIRFPKEDAAAAKELGKTLFIYGHCPDATKPHKDGNEQGIAYVHPMMAQALYMFCFLVQYGKSPREAFDSIKWENVDKAIAADLASSPQEAQ
jgi:hypothetical protein